MSITIGDYTITVVRGDPSCDYFIQHCEGEGMGVTEAQLQAMFGAFFAENF